MDPVTTTAIITVGAAAANKFLGPTANAMGEDLKELYAKGRDLILSKGVAKTRDLDTEGKTNLRVTRDVFWNGSFTDDSICAEYFGGVLASSRSVDGKDDSGVFYVDIIKSLSSGQLRMHYILYRLLNKYFLSNEEKSSVNPGMENDLSREKLFVFLNELRSQLNNEDLGAILHALHAKGLIGVFQTEVASLEDGRSAPYLWFTPKSLGIQLFAIANNMFLEWRSFSSVDFSDFEEITLPQYFGDSIQVILESAGLKEKS